jgi:hypothetical protein
MKAPPLISLGFIKRQKKTPPTGFEPVLPP